MALRVVIAPTTEPVLLADIKTYLRVDFADDDALISAFIIAAREYCESFQNRAYVTQTLEITLDQFPYRDWHPAMNSFPFYPMVTPTYHTSRHKNSIKLLMPPIQSVTSVTYTDSTGLATVVDPTTYIVDTDSEPGRIVPVYGQQWPVVQLQPINGVRVRYVAGYGVAANVPQAVKQAMQLLISHWYQNREAISIMVTRSVSAEIEFGVKALLSSERVIPT